MVAKQTQQSNSTNTGEMGLFKENLNIIVLGLEIVNEGPKKSPAFRQLKDDAFNS